MSLSTFLTPRKEVISDEGIEGIIDLANLSDSTQKKIETRPRDFFNLTYPTSDIRRVIERLNDRFQSSSDTPGLFLFEGLKGSGKSHLLLLIHNLFTHQKDAASWLVKNDMKCSMPDDSTVIVNKFTDSSSYSIWDIIFSKLNYKYTSDKPTPDLDDLKTVLGSRHIMLIFDELEQGIRVIDKPAVKHQNIAFLQMLSEFSNRSKQITIFASIYSDRDEPGSTFKRVPSVRVQFSDSRYEDKNSVILHRLFENATQLDKNTISPVIDSYIELYKKHTDIELLC